MNHLSNLCISIILNRGLGIECEANGLDNDNSQEIIDELTKKCVLFYGDCNHCFHEHCIEKYLLRT